MKKIKWFFNIEKEEQWLNEQLQKGFRCTGISGFGIYTFDKTEKQYVMRLDYQDYLPKDKLQDYKGIYEDFGWHYIKGSWLSGIRYWQKEEGNQNEIFSDRQSKGKYYKRLMGYSFLMGMLCLALSYMIYKDLSGFYHDGLWNMEGALFWYALLFETPFVLLKLSPVMLAILFGSSFYSGYRNYSVLIEK
ncbi:DUF2812 domain-containing protein [Geomicrobium sediminis]|uniref:DUF2812 domain-containing protein n=1 Tax=Geomicrobium sediminis TaxID=1347788 RepID=A0ABS2PHG9_9BACL|nr:DUF2812 domain-containing protein [Geomicrobium sediminis]MBM7634890.1 hypothetical protein [Geomicrobium sediminis]